MSGGGGGIIIRRNMRIVAETGSVSDQLGPMKRSRLSAILGKDEEDWTHEETHFVIRCVREAYEAYE